MKKCIFVNEKNRDAIDTSFADAQKGCSARKAGYDDVISSIDAIERHLNIPKTRMMGVTADVDIHAQDFAKAYAKKSYSPPQSTHFRLERKRSGWALIGVHRSNCRGDGKTTQLHLTDAAREAVIKRVENPF